MIHIEIPTKYIKDAPMNGNPDYIPQLDAYAANMFKYGILPKTKNGVTTVELIDDAEDDFDIEHFKMLISLSEVKVTGYKSTAYFKVSDMNETIPDFLPNSIVNTYDEETGELISSRPKTWKEWVKPNYTVEEIDGFFYFLNYAGTGNNLSNDVIIKLFDIGIELIKKPVIEEVPNV